jgi:hypothetical protein
MGRERSVREGKGEGGENKMEGRRVERRARKG